METFTDCFGFIYENVLNFGRSIGQSILKCTSPHSSYEPILLQQEDGPVQRRKLTFLDVITSLWPYIWPSGNTSLHINVALSLICMFCTNIVSMLIPITFKHAVDDLSGF
jgi:hypothetical protein